MHKNIYCSYINRMQRLIPEFTQEWLRESIKYEEPNDIGLYFMLLAEFILFKLLSANSDNVIKKIFLVIDKELERNKDHIINSIQTCMLESVVNYILNTPIYYDRIYSLVGPNAKKYMKLYERF